MNENSWENIPEDISEWFGYVYRIERINALPGEKRFYIGKKQFWSNIKLKPLKGKTRKRKVQKESDWKKYFSSSKDLQNEIKIHGPENFKRVILHVCESKWAMSYMETLEQLRHSVLFDELYHNGIVHIRIGKCPAHLKEKYNEITKSLFKWKCPTE